MYKVNEIKELIRALDKSSIGEIEIRGENKEKITIKKEGAVRAAAVETIQTPQPQAAPSVPQPEAPAPAAPKEESPAKAPEQAETPEAKDDSLEEITSPMVGTFYRSPSPDADPYVKEGDKVGEESVVCIVEAMKLMNELEAEISGEIVEILVENGELVEYGQPLFLVKTA
ncbi:acetyl-CoA carboxylase biotin carboxyl carrier protein [Alteribacillus bidgolensis]|uniref:Biotin carboxyl carrier protein of acetyl-CoA carboxylase n=1 Tax=Alteribacillus bidgolensis TaxID=930129 RepID=A0A1G8MIB5_9BACI|nr:acetyl-CoA carboxylase biotin carboxyl carrier protein [Alteribacillus bidgolensis]SDI67731.1 acetyl-CoA carboxylase biotin carboxyl carrier protein [Alteribacillus bidgolensis]